MVRPYRSSETFFELKRLPRTQALGYLACCVLRLAEHTSARASLMCWNIPMHSFRRARAPVGTREARVFLRGIARLREAFRGLFARSAVRH